MKIFNFELNAYKSFVIFLSRQRSMIDIKLILNNHEYHFFSRLLLDLLQEISTSLISICSRIFQERPSKEAPGSNFEHQVENTCQQS